MMRVLGLLALLAVVQGRAVNISNTWMLPEEGFPVFYRYFRDRISWYEADAVCQFHHANLVTVDTTAQYDAVRAYLKELDISSAVWVGLIRSNPDGDFTWTDYRGLSGDGYWSSAPDSAAAPLCAAANPAADYRWEARACGGPMVASFICELPVPQWASGSQGCMVKAIPALTALYLPESAAVQLTVDCGLAGVRKVQCTGNVKRDELLKQLACDDANEESSTFTADLTSEATVTTTDDVSTTQNSIDTSSTQIPLTSVQEISSILPSQTPSAHDVSFSYEHDTIDTQHRVAVMHHIVPLHKSYNIDMIPEISQNLESNDIPTNPEKEGQLTDDQINQIQDEKRIQHKMLHEEIARLGNPKSYEKIFTQSSDHFIPPLVMAKSRVSDDMEEVSIQAKHAQQFAGGYKFVHPTQYPQTTTILTERPIESTTVRAASTIKDTVEKPIKLTYRKKYNEKQYENKNNKFLKKRVEKVADEKFEKSAETIEPPSLELKVTLTEPEDIVKTEQLTKTTTTQSSPSTPSKENLAQTTNNFDSEITSTKDIIATVTIPSKNQNTPPILIEVTTLMPIFHDKIDKMDESKSSTPVEPSSTPADLTQHIKTSNVTENYDNHSATAEVDTSTESTPLQTVVSNNKTSITADGIIKSTTATNLAVEHVNNTESPAIVSSSVEVSKADLATESIESINIDPYHDDSFEESVDAKSPLLSGASEPLRRPNRMRRPQTQTRMKRFNLLRILG